MLDVFLGDLEVFVFRSSFVLCEFPNFFLFSGMWVYYFTEFFIHLFTPPPCRFRSTGVLYCSCKGRILVWFIVAKEEINIWQVSSVGLRVGCRGTVVGVTVKRWGKDALDSDLGFSQY